MPVMKLRFSIRDLFWLVLVVALAVGWWLDHRYLKARSFEDLKLTVQQGPQGPGPPVKIPDGGAF
jgi:hypothetical protein